MPSFSVIRTLCREAVSRQARERIPEPDLVMDDPEKVAAFTRAGKEDSVMAPVYLFHCAQVSEVIKPGDTVVDLGCGPATQLAMVARLNPQVNFVGVDLSPEMLDKAREHVSSQNLSNVEFRTADITNLSDFDDSSVDAVMSTVVLHHLPDRAALACTFSEINRVLKPQGGLYLVDFGLLKSEKSIESFAYQYADRQPELFTLDYLYSLRAAFELTDFQSLAEKYFDNGVQVKSTFMMPYMVTVKSPVRADIGNQELTTELKKIRDKMPKYHQRDFNDLKTFFRLGGLRSNLL